MLGLNIRTASLPAGAHALVGRMDEKNPVNTDKIDGDDVCEGSKQEVER